jgi:hypothetical protein
VEGMGHPVALAVAGDEISLGLQDTSIRKASVAALLNGQPADKPPPWHGTHTRLSRPWQNDCVRAGSDEAGGWGLRGWRAVLVCRGDAPGGLQAGTPESGRLCVPPLRPHLLPHHLRQVSQAPEGGDLLSRVIITSTVSWFRFLAVDPHTDPHTDYPYVGG